MGFQALPCCFCQTGQPRWVWELWQQGGGWGSSATSQELRRPPDRGPEVQLQRDQPHRHRRVGQIQCQAASSSLWETSPYNQEGCDPKTTESCQDFGNADGMKGTKSKPGITATNQEQSISCTPQTPLCAPWKAPRSPRAYEPLLRCFQQAHHACGYGESSPSPPAQPVKPSSPTSQT